jgi:hypothetical protein
MDELELMHITVGAMMAKHGLTDFSVTRKDAQECLKGKGIISDIHNDTITVRFRSSDEVERLESELRREDDIREQS